MAIKVSQATIDKIKKQGMTKALAGASSANAEMREGLRRMYGQARLDKAMGSSTPTAPRYTSPEAARRVASIAKPKATSMVDAKGPNAIKPKRVSDAQKLVRGVKSVLNSSPGKSLKTGSAAKTVKKVLNSSPGAGLKKAMSKKSK